MRSLYASVPRSSDRRRKPRQRLAHHLLVAEVEVYGFLHLPLAFGCVDGGGIFTTVVAEQRKKGWKPAGKIELASFEPVSSIRSCSSRSS
ncbi:MAG: hypothetical protein HY847_09105 [Betaproteobacteria bacterium]|nr:hypothetical protein [Betaproteobacteria bacterium]